MQATNINIAAAITLMVVGPMIFLLLPLYIGAIADSYGYPEDKLGLFASAELLGIAVSSSIAPMWINKINWRITSMLMLIGIIGGNYLSVFVTDFTVLFGLRCFTGLLVGVLLAIASSLLSYAGNPDRAYSITVFTQISIQIVSFLILPGIISRWFLEGFLYYVILIQLTALPLLHFIPPRPQYTSQLQNPKLGSTGAHRPCWIILASILCFFIAQIAVFGFIDLLGNDYGLDDQSIGFALSISTFVALGGPFLAAVLGIRIGRFWPIVIGGCAQLLVLALFELTTSVIVYTILLSFFQFFWTLVVGYQFGILVQEDKDHRFVAIAPAAAFAGVALGPLLGGYALELGGHVALYLISGSSLLVYMVLMLPYARIKQHKVLINKA